jgi:voltage-gated sodium channel
LLCGKIWQLRAMLTANFKKISEAKWFQNVMLGVILLAAVLVGLHTDQAIMQRWGEVLHRLDQLVLGLFTIELIIRIGAYGARPWLFFRDLWNIFDFLVVVICFLPLHSEFAAVLRLVRVLRVVRLVKAVPRLQLLVGALLKSVPSMGYVALLLMLHFYIYAVIGVSFFHITDAEKFGSLPRAMLTLFEIVTLEGWVDVMGKQLEGATPWQQFGAVFYFLSFILSGTMIMLNLLIGVIMKSMEETGAEMAEEKVAVTPEATATELEKISLELSSIQTRLMQQIAAQRENT